MDEYVIPDQKLVAWGGNDSWEYEFVEEQVRENGHTMDSMSSEEDTAVVDTNHDVETPVEAQAPVAQAAVENDRKISLNTLPTVFHSVDQDSRKQ